MILHVQEGYVRFTTVPLKLNLIKFIFVINVNNSGEENSKPCVCFKPEIKYVRFGHKYYDKRFSNFFCAESKYQLKKLFPTYY